MAGTEVSPSPVPISSICPTMTAYGVVVALWEIQANAPPKSSRPVLTTARVPTRPARRAPATEERAMLMATGRMRRPVERVP